MAKSWKTQKRVRFYDRESTVIRRMTVRAYKTRCKRLLHNGGYEMIPPFKRTGGWETW